MVNGLAPGTAVGTGLRGGVLVTTPGGGTVERFISPLRSVLRRGGGGRSAREIRRETAEQNRIATEKARIKAELDAQLKAKKEAERVKAEQAAIERFEKSAVGKRQLAQISARTGPGTAVITAFDPDIAFREQQERLRREGGPRARVIPSILRGTGRLFSEGLLAQGGDIVGIPTDARGPKAFVKELERAEGFKKEDPFAIIPEFGTISDITRGPSSIQTIGERQANIEAKRNLKLLNIKLKAEKNQRTFDQKLQENQRTFNQKLQKLIDAGKITLEEAITKQEKNLEEAITRQEKNVKNINKQIEKDVEEVFVKGEKDILTDPFERKQTLRQSIRFAVDSAVIGAGVLSPAIPLVFFGTRAIEESPKAETFGERAAVGLDIGFAVAGGVGVLGKAGQEAFQASTEAALAEVAGKRTISRTVTVRTKKGVLQVSRGRQVSPLGEIETIGGIKIRITKDQRRFFSDQFPGGGIQKVTKVEIPFRTVPFRGSERKFLIAVEQAEPKAVGLIKPIDGRTAEFIGVSKAQVTKRVGVITEFDPRAGEFVEFARLKPQKIPEAKPEIFFGRTRQLKKGRAITGIGRIEPRPAEFRQVDISKTFNLEELGRAGQRGGRPSRPRPKPKPATPSRPVTTQFQVETIITPAPAFATPKQLSREFFIQDITKVVKPVSARTAVQQVIREQQDISKIIGITTKQDIALTKKQKAKIAQISISDSLVGQDIVPAQTDIQQVSQVTVQQFKTPQLTQLSQVTQFVSPLIVPTALEKPVIDFTPGPPGFVPLGGFIFDKDLDFGGVKRVKGPHDVFLRTRGKRKKIADNVTQMEALDIGSFVTDKSLSAQFSLKKSKGKLKDPPFNVPSNYYNLNQNKFRSFQIIRGKQKPLKNTFIEKRNRRLDTAGEVNKITANRLIANQQRQNRQMAQLSRGFQNILGSPVAPKRRKSSSGRKAPPKKSVKRPRRKR